MPIEEAAIRYSIIIPSRNRLQSLENCLCTIQALTYPKNHLEVIIVLDGDAENLEPLRAWCGQMDFSVRVVLQERAGPAAARNRGVLLARGEYLAFTDDDCLLFPNWLNLADATFALDPACLLGGPIFPLPEANLYSRATHALLQAVYQFYNCDPKQAAFLVSCHMLMPRSAFAELGGFDAGFWTSEDRDFCARWRSSGRRMTCDQQLGIHHDQKDNFVGFFRRHFRYGEGGYQFHRKQAEVLQRSFQLAPFAFYQHLASVLGALIYPGKKYRLTLLILISQLASFMGFFWQALRLGRMGKPSPIRSAG